MKCVILAATHNERLAGFGEPTAFIRLLGVRLIDRALKSAMQAGLTQFVIVTATEDRVVRQYLDKFAHQHAIDIEHVVNDSPRKGNGYAVSLVQERVGEQAFLLLSVESLFDAETVKGLMAQSLEGIALRATIDRNTLAVKTDLMTVIRVQTEGNHVLAMNMGLPEFNAFNTGTYLCSPAIFAVIKSEMEQRASATLIDAIQRLVKEQRVGVFDVNGQFWNRIDSLEAFTRTEEDLLKSVNQNSADTLVRRHVLRPCSRQLTQVFLNSPLGLKAISGLGLATAVLAALLLSVDHYAGLLFGGLLALVAVVIHVSHEEVAVLSHQKTPYLTWFERVVSQYSEVAILLGLTLHAAHSDYYGINPILVGGIAIIGSLMFHYSSDQYQQMVGPRPPRRHEFDLHRDWVFVICALCAIANIPMFALLLFMVLFNAMVAHRLFGWDNNHNHSVP